MIDAVPVWPPLPGHYAMRLVRDGPRVAVRIWFGAAIIDGEEQDRAPGWFVEIDGQTDREECDATGYRCRIPLDVNKAWPWCAREPIDEDTYRYLVACASWARDHSPDHPKAQPHKAVDFHTLPVRF